MMMTLLLPALLMGLLGSPHCMGMCGGVIAAFGLSIQTASPYKRALLITTYHLGRITSYMLLGAVAMLFGEQVLAPFLTGNVLPRIILGTAIIFAALLMLGAPFLNRLESVGLRLWNTLAPIRQKVLPMDNMPKAMAAGLLWGLLPCGLVYGALVMAASVSATSQTPALGVLFMLAFGMGTLPMLLLSGVALSWLQTKIKAFNLRKFSGALMLASGVLVMFSPVAMHYMHSGHGHQDHHAGHTHHTDHSHHQHQDHQH